MIELEMREDPLDQLAVEIQSILPRKKMHPAEFERRPIVDVTGGDEVAGIVRLDHLLERLQAIEPPARVGGRQLDRVCVTMNRVALGIGEFAGLMEVNGLVEGLVQSEFSLAPFE